jgi:arsenate reductase
MNKVFGIKNCDTMKKAMAFRQRCRLRIHRLQEGRRAESHLADWNARAGWEKLLNKRGLMWKKLSEAERADVDEAKALALMAQYPALIKRPVLDTGSQLIVGFTGKLCGAIEMSSSFVRRFLFEGLDIRGAIVTSAMPGKACRPGAITSRPSPSCSAKRPPSRR